MAAIQLEIYETLLTYRVSPPLPSTDPDQDGEGERLTEMFDMENETEELRRLSLDALWEKLGLHKSKQIVGLDRYHDINGEASSWTLNAVDWWKQLPAEQVRQQHPRHHQLVGLVKILTWMMEQKGGLVADAVGVGKTLQVIMAVLERANIIDRYMKTGDSPPFISM